MPPDGAVYRKNCPGVALRPARFHETLSTIARTAVLGGADPRVRGRRPRRPAAVAQALDPSSEKRDEGVPCGPMQADSSLLLLGGIYLGVHLDFHFALHRLCRGLDLRFHLGPLSPR